MTEGAWRSHFYRRVQVAEHLRHSSIALGGHYTAIALVEGASAGPTIRFEQCIDCDAIRITMEGGDVRYISGSLLSIAESECPRSRRTLGE
jgi:hypothetical protein